VSAAPPDRVFADRAGVTWHLTAHRRTPAERLDHARRHGGAALPPSGLVFTAAGGRSAVLALSVPNVPGPERVAAYTWAELLRLLAAAQRARP
jgi:hypothetical protein